MHKRAPEIIPFTLSPSTRGTLFVNPHFSGDTGHHRIIPQTFGILLGVATFALVFHLSLYHTGIVDFPMHPLHVSGHVHLLLGLVYAIGALELGLFTALPFLMIPERTFQLVGASAIAAYETTVFLLNSC